MKKVITATLYAEALEKQIEKRKCSLEDCIKSYSFDTSLQSEVENAMADLGYSNKDYWLKFSQLTIW